MLLIHRNDCAILYKQRQLPKRCIKVVHNLSAAILLSGEVINPNLLVIRQIDVISNIIAVFLRVGILINRRNKEAIAKHILILGILAVSICIIWCFEEHRTNHWQATIMIAFMNIGS